MIVEITGARALEETELQTNSLVVYRPCKFHCGIGARLDLRFQFFIVRTLQITNFLLCRYVNVRIPHLV